MEHEEFARVFSAAIRDRGLSLERIRRRLQERGSAVSVATLSYWSSGRSRPTRVRSQQTLIDLEHILELPPGRLTNLMDGLSPRDLGQEACADSPVLQMFHNTVDRWGLQRNVLIPVFTHDTVNIGPRRKAEWVRTRMMMKAATDGVNRWPVFVTQGPIQSFTTHIGGTVGCRVGRVEEMREYGALAAELVLDRPLNRGEVAVIDCMWYLSETDCEHTGLERCTSGTVDWMIGEALFSGNGASRPVSSKLVNPIAPSPGRALRDTIFKGSGRVQGVFQRPREGAVGITWEWPRSDTPKSGHSVILQ